MDINQENVEISEIRKLSAKNRILQRKKYQAVGKPSGESVRLGSRQ